MVVKGRQEAQAVVRTSSLKEGSTNNTWNVLFLKVLNYNIKNRSVRKLVSIGEKTSDDESLLEKTEGTERT